MKHLSLCSGIGGLDLAAEQAGFETVAQCEIDDYASRVLAKNFKGVPNLHDIRAVTNERLAVLGINAEEITVISAGFPCQPYSLAGKGLGDRDERDLWSEVARVLGEVKPRWFVGENTPGLYSRANQRYFRRVLRDLAALGYRVGWGMWGACDVGAPHRRNRIFIVAYSDGERRRVLPTNVSAPCGALGDAEAKAPGGTGSLYGAEQGGGNYPGNLPYADGERREADKAAEQRAGETLDQEGQQNEFSGRDSVQDDVSDADGEREQQQERKRQKIRGRAFDGSWWGAEPDVGRVAHGIPARVDRIRGLGNAVAPAQAYPIFKAIAEYERSRGEKV